MSRRNRALGNAHHAAQQLGQAVAIDAQVGRVADVAVQPRRAFGERQLPRPDMRLRVRVDGEAAAADLRHRVRGGCLDPVDLARQQRSGARVGLGHRQHHHAVDLRGALRIPVALVGRHFEPLARNEAGHPERTGAGRVRRERRPGGLGLVGRRGALRGVELLLPVRGAGHEQVGQVQRQERVGLAGCQLNRHVVDLAGAAQRGHARGGHADLAGVEVHGLLVEHLADVPYHRIGVEGRAIVELHARAQLEHPLGLVLGINRPGGGQTGDQHAGRIGLRQIPVRERVVHGNAGEAVALEALVGLAERARDVRRCHGDAQDLLLRGRGAAIGERAERDRAGTSRHKHLSVQSVGGHAFLLERSDCRLKPPSFRKGHANPARVAVL